MQAKGLLSGNWGKMIVMPGNGAHPVPKSPFNSRGVGYAVPNSGLKAWFDPSKNIILNGSGVSSWSDTTGTYTISQATAINQPTYLTGSLYGGHPYLSFDGSNDRLFANLALGIGTNNFQTVVAFVKFNSNTVNQSALAFNSASSGGYVIYNTATAVSVGFWNPPVPNLLPAAAITLNTNPNMLCLEIDRQAGFIYASANGNYRGARSAIAANNNNYASGIFEMSRSGFLISMHMLDVFIYDKLLTESEFQQLYNYLKAKYGT